MLLPQPLQLPHADLKASIATGGLVQLHTQILLSPVGAGGGGWSSFL